MRAGAHKLSALFTMTAGELFKSSMFKCRNQLLNITKYLQVQVISEVNDVNSWDPPEENSVLRMQTQAGEVSTHKHLNCIFN